MIRKTLTSLSMFALLITAACLPSVQAQEGQALYEQYCATCHAAPTDLRTPSRAALGTFTANSIFHALDAGLMQAQGNALSTAQKVALAEYLSNGRFNAQRVETLTACSAPMPSLDLGGAGNWNGWGNGGNNARAQSAAGSSLNVDNVGSLELAWAFGFEDSSNARAQPSVINGVMFLGSNTGTLYALDLASGCAYWTSLATSEVRGALSVVDSPALGKTLLVGADVSNRVFVLDARTGERVWHADVDPHPFARSTGSPVVADNKIFVPVSSIEVAAAGNPNHACCTFRGNMAAYDLNTGEKLWHTYIMDEAVQVGSNAAGKAVLAPSGAPIWDAPTVDLARKRVYVGTGQNYTRPASATSDAIIAFNMDTGAMEWVHQTTEHDAFTMACTTPGHPNCPDAGPDFDIGASVLNAQLSDGRNVLVAGTKGAMVFGLDPNDGGKLLWETRVGRGSALGGVHWGMSFVGDTAFVPVSDRALGGGEGMPRQPGLHALDMKTGASLWYTPAPARCADGPPACNDAYSSAVSATQDLVFAGSLSGVLFAHDQKDGAVLWEFDTRQEFSTLNGVPAKGGAIDSVGPVIAGDYLIVNSGYATFGQLPGNALLVFRLPRP